MQLTKDQLLDIILQTDDRVSKNILACRSAEQAFLDEHLVYNESGTMIYVGSLKEKFKSLFYIFNQEAKHIKEHPRSLKNAKLELKALGFSKQQVSDIWHRVQNFNFSDHNGILPGIENSFYVHDDRAVLGIAILPAKDGTLAGIPVKEPDFDAEAENNCYPEANEDEIRKRLSAHIPEHADFLNPAYKARVKEQVPLPII